jgi:hypothetical protein
MSGSVAMNVLSESEFPAWQQKAAKWQKKHGEQLPPPSFGWDSHQWQLPSADIPALLACTTGDGGSAVVDAVRRWCDSVADGPLEHDHWWFAAAAGHCVPALASQLPTLLWGELLQRLHGMLANAGDPSAPAVARWVMGCELPMALGRCGDGLPGGKALLQQGTKSLSAWLKEDDELIETGLSDQARSIWSIIASVIRCDQVLATQKRRPKLRLQAIRKLALWGLSLQRNTSTAHFDWPLAIPRLETVDAIIQFLQPCDAVASAWQIVCDRHAAKRLNFNDAELPDVGLWHENAAVGVWRGSWRHRRGRVALQAAGRSMRLELASGNDLLLDGIWVPIIRLADETIEPIGDWEEVCWQSDDDVHYLELEQRWSQGVRLQRQVMTIRDDDAFYLSDAVLSSGDQPIEYASRLPTGTGIRAAIPTEDARELQLDGPKKTRALVLPLDLPEWRTQPAHGKLTWEASALHLAIQGRGRLAASLWFDLDSERFAQQRTWRQLTIGENLKLARRDQAVGYRIQVQQEQWVVYRTLTAVTVPPTLRTVLGRNLGYDFLCGRFDASDGTVDSLIEVEQLEE